MFFYQRLGKSISYCGDKGGAEDQVEEKFEVRFHGLGVLSDVKEILCQHQEPLETAWKGPLIHYASPNNGILSNAQADSLAIDRN